MYPFSLFFYSHININNYQQDSLPGSTALTIYVLPIQELVDGNFFFNGSRSTKHQSDIEAQLPSHISYRQYTKVESKSKAKKSKGSGANKKARNAAKREATAKHGYDLVASINKSKKAKKSSTL